MSPLSYSAWPIPTRANSYFLYTYNFRVYHSAFGLEYAGSMERTQLVHFVAVVEAGGFNRAARSLHISQPALSKSIKALEVELGAQLFQRTPSGAQVTLVGQGLA